MHKNILTCWYALICVGYASTQNVVLSDFQSDPKDAIAYGFTNVYTIKAKYASSETRVFQWMYNSTVVAVAQYTPDGEQLFIDPPSPRFNLSANGIGLELFMELHLFNVTSSDAGSSICVTAEKICSTDLTFILNVTECVPKIDGTVSGGTTESPCGKGCTADFSCAENFSGTDVTAECQYDATWSPMIICRRNCPINESVECDNQRCDFNTMDGEIKFGETVPIDCGNNYRNDSSVTCGEDGKWNDTNCTFECSGEVGASWACPNCTCNPSYTGVLDSTHDFYCEECEGSGTSNCTRNGWITLTSCFVTRIESLETTGLYLFSPGGIAGTVIGCFAAGAGITALLAWLLIRQ